MAQRCFVAESLPIKRVIASSCPMHIMQEEAEAVTEISDAEEAAWSILDRPGAVTQWCVIKLGGEGALLCAKSPRRQYRQSSLQVGSIAVAPASYQVQFWQSGLQIGSVAATPAAYQRQYWLSRLQVGCTSVAVALASHQGLASQCLNRMALLAMWAVTRRQNKRFQGFK